MPSTVTVTSWPGSIGPTPSGVPVRMTSPGSRVVYEEMNATISAIPRTRSEVFPSCTSSPSSVVVSRRFATSARLWCVVIQGPSGQNVS